MNNSGDSFTQWAVIRLGAILGGILGGCLGMDDGVIFNDRTFLGICLGALSGVIGFGILYFWLGAIRIQRSTMSIIERLAAPIIIIMFGGILFAASQCSNV